jgi:sulfite reductase subunit B
MTTLLHETLTNESIYMPIPARITRVQRHTPIEKVFDIELPSGFLLNHEPGQFVELSLLGVGECPISISCAPSLTENKFTLTIRAVGKVTEKMHTLEPGAMVGIRSPFGRPFPIDEFRGKDMLMVAGGLGLAPLRSVIDEVLYDRGQFGRVIIMYGTRSPEFILFPEEIEKWQARKDVEFLMTVDHPTPEWTGRSGVITTLLPEVDFNGRNMIAVVVGPPIMYRFVVPEVLKRGVPEGNVWMSFERQMKCAVGKCGHCQMHHIYTCQDGPSFNYLEVKDLEEAFA